MLGQPQQRSHITRPANRAIDTAPAAPAAQPAAGGPAAEGKPEGAPHAPEGSAAKPPPAVDSAAGVKDGGTPPPESPQGEKPKEAISAAEESQRIARIHRAEARHQQQVATDRQAIADEKRALEGERTRHAESLRRVEQIDQLRQKPPASWLRFMGEVFGVQPQVLIDELIGHQQKKPEQLAQERQATESQQIRSQLAEMQKAIQDGAKAQEQARAAEQLQQYKSQQIAPLLADSAKYELTNRALGKDAVDQVYGLMANRYRIVQAGKNGQAIAGLTAQQAASLKLLSPVEAADMIEAHFRKQRDTLSGTSATPAKPPEPKTTDEPPRAEASGSQAQKPPPKAAQSPAWRAPPKPYNRRRI